MNKDYISIVYSACNSIRGVISADDYPFVVLPVLLLQWAKIKNEEEGLACYREIYSPGRLSATYGGEDKAEQVIEYLLQIAESQKNVTGGYISEVSSVLRNVPEKVFSDILRILSSAELTSIKSICAFANGFIRYASRMYYGKTYGSTLSASGVAQIAKVLLGETSENDKVFDGFAGTGISTITATSGKGIITLQEANIRMACIAEILCILNGCTATITVCDSLTGCAGEGDYTKVVTEPPFSYRRPELKEMDLPFYSPDPDMMCIKHALHNMADKGVAVVLCPAGVLFRGGHTGLEREVLICNRNIDTVIQLPGGAISGTGVTTALLVLKKKRKEEDVLFVDASKLLESTDKTRTDFILKQENEELLRDIFEQKKEVAEISRLVTRSEMSHHEFSLVVNQYLSEPNADYEKVDIKPLVDESNSLLRKLNDLDGKLERIRDRYIVYK